MKNFSELTTDEKIAFADEVMDINRNMVKNFINNTNILFNYGVLDAHDLDTKEKIPNKALDILIDINTNFYSLEDAYAQIKKIVDKINTFKKIYKDFDIQKALNFAEKYK